MKKLSILLALIAIFSDICGVNHIVFIHGTVFPGLTALTNPWDITVTQDVASTSCYREALSMVRKDPFYYESQIMYEIGLHTIDLQQLANNQQYAAYQIAHVFKTLSNKHDAYHVFGWLGELTVKGRKIAAKKLYNDLIKLMQPGDTLTLIGHSHGGNVIAYLAEEELVQKKGLCVLYAYLLATPIQPETAYLFNQPLFKNVISMYSYKDNVQTSDNISTPSRKSHRMLSKYFDNMVQSHTRLLDVEITVHGKSIFGHRAFFYFDQIRVPAFEAFFGHHHFTLDAFKPLPLAALIPILEPVLHAIPQDVTHLRADMYSSGDDWYLRLYGSYECYRSKNYFTQLQAVKKHVEKEWSPRACTNEIKRNICAAGAAIQHRVGIASTTICYPLGEIE